jgi:hypothetical protein
MNIKNGFRVMALSSAAVLVACGAGDETSSSLESAQPEQGQSGQVHAMTTCTFNVSAESFYVQRDQRTTLANLEGLLELQGMFAAAGTSSVKYPSWTPVMTAERYQTVVMNWFITNVTVNDTASVPLKAELWEIEYGSQGADDYGVQWGTMNLDCTQPSASQTLTVNISADNYKEKSGIVTVTFKAVRQ